MDFSNMAHHDLFAAFEPDLTSTLGSVSNMKPPDSHANQYGDAIHCESDIMAGLLETQPPNYHPLSSLASHPAMSLPNHTIPDPMGNAHSTQMFGHENASTPITSPSPVHSPTHLPHQQQPPPPQQMALSHTSMAGPSDHHVYHHMQPVQRSPMFAPASLWRDSASVPQALPLYTPSSYHSSTYDAAHQPAMPPFASYAPSQSPQLHHPQHHTPPHPQVHTSRQSYHHQQQFLAPFQLQQSSAAAAPPPQQHVAPPPPPPPQTSPSAASAANALTPGVQDASTPQSSPSADASRSRFRPAPSPETLEWLGSNYIRADGQTLPRSALYEHYLEFCNEHKLEPVNAASFGKIIRLQFPGIKTRRLGIRGQSKYHYVNLARRDKRKAVRMVLPKNPVVPEFLDVSRAITDGIDQRKVSVFFSRYHSFWQHLFDTVLRQEFHLVEETLGLFWKSIPPEYYDLLNHPIVQTNIRYCDRKANQLLCNSLIPDPFHAIPFEMMRGIRMFAQEHARTTSKVLSSLPASLVKTKDVTVKSLVRQLRRLTAISHVAQATSTVLASDTTVAAMLQDWNSLDFAHLDGLYATHIHMGPTGTVAQLCTEFGKLFTRGTHIEDFASWQKALFLKCRSQSDHKRRQFVLKWTFFSSAIIRQLTILNAPTCGSFHLLRLFLDEHALHLVELEDEMLQQQEDKTHLQNVMGEAQALVPPASTPTTTETPPTLHSLYDSHPLAHAFGHSLDDDLQFSDLLSPDFNPT
eukprot:m.293764 g.293764  ORF g.293764 m.293764 type:complete len:749 (-) comp12869_c0_seq1:175-2421(-)